MPTKILKKVYITQKNYDKLSYQDKVNDNFLYIIVDEPIYKDITIWEKFVLKIKILIDKLKKKRRVKWRKYYQLLLSD